MEDPLNIVNFRQSGNPDFWKVQKSRLKKCNLTIQTEIWLSWVQGYEMQWQNFGTKPNKLAPPIFKFLQVSRAYEQG